MFSDYYIKNVTSFFGKVIKSVNGYDDIVIFTFDDSILEMQVQADCCSVSWLETVDKPFTYCAGKVMKSFISHDDLKIVLPPSKKQSYDKNHLYQIIFDDGTDFMFYLRNSSNGYYDGWLYFKVVELNTGIIE